MNFVSYIRVSTQKQGHSGLGLDAQKAAVERYVAGRRGVIVSEFQEIESGRKGAALRPALVDALAYCKANNAALVIGKLDRLARDVRFFLEVLDDSKVDIRFADLPDIDPKTDEGRMILIGMANYAEFEGRRIGTRTKAALTAAKARGVVLGKSGTANLRRNVEARKAAADAHAEALKVTLAEFAALKLSQRRQVEELNKTETLTPGGKKVWTQVQLQRVIARLAPARA
jgi:DNA invertase Pin-like site-specific DNA recombinase